MNEKIIAVLERVRPGISNNLNAKFVSEGILDSLDLMNAIVAIEEEFSIEIDPEEVLTDNFESVESVAALVVKYTENNK